MATSQLHQFQQRVAKQELIVAVVKPMLKLRRPMNVPPHQAGKSEMQDKQANAERAV